MYHKYISKSPVGIFISALLVMGAFSSCKKYLDAKPSESLRVPTTILELEGVLDNAKVNEYSPFFSEIVADNYYLPTSIWNGQGADIRNNYIWDKNALVTIENSCWTNPYLAIYQSNFVLDNLASIKFGTGEQQKYEALKGGALYFRAFYHHALAQLYCNPYTASSNTDMGIVVRLTSDIEVPVTRASVKQTYEQIIKDLKEAIALLPEKAAGPTRANKAAACGLLARVYLTMGDYINAGVYANQSLGLNGNLLDYNSLTPSNNPSLPLANNNPEVSVVTSSYPNVLNSNAIIDSVLYRSYDANDLRKVVFFGLNGTNPFWKGSYWNRITNSIFDGISTNEQYLIRAEVNARAGNVTAAMNDLNKLLRNRYKTGTFTDLVAANPADALDIILNERRKELAFRGLRWSDLRRLNLEGRNITIRRIINNTEYTLPPNDLRWTLLIPQVEIFRSGIPQNPR